MDFLIIPLSMSTLHIEDKPILFQLPAGPEAYSADGSHVRPTGTTALSGRRTLQMSSNTIYREILMITGATPDVNRDYQFKLTIPETLENLKEQRKTG